MKSNVTSIVILVQNQNQRDFYPPLLKLFIELLKKITFYDVKSSFTKFQMLA